MLYTLLSYMLYNFVMAADWIYHLTIPKAGTFLQVPHQGKGKPYSAKLQIRKT